MEPKKIIEFVRQKDFKFIKEIGRGSFGETVLLEDEYIDYEFVCKKYSPFEFIDKEAFYKNFINEIKTLHLLYNRNIVRVFNYYLYPKLHLGYLMMEYINGETISDYLEKYPENLNDIFKQVIEGFSYLESHKILHRDIRDNNILVDDKGIVKIIDFGFSKKINFDGDNQKSISINWISSVLPDDFKMEIYDHTTEIFFVGKLFEDIMSQINSSFKYKTILKKMIEVNPKHRISSFKLILKEINEKSFTLNLFNKDEKSIYKNLAESFSTGIVKREESSNIISDIDKIIKNLDTLHQKTMLEDFVNSKHLLRVFIDGEYQFSNTLVEVESIQNFTSFFKSISREKQNIILYHLSTRFDDVFKYSNNVYIDDEEIPF